MFNALTMPWINLHRTAWLWSSKVLMTLLYKHSYQLTVAQGTKASETQTVTLASIKEDILLCPESDEEEEKKGSNTNNTQLNISATKIHVMCSTWATITWWRNLVLWLRDVEWCPRKSFRGSFDAHAFVQENEKSPAKIASLIDSMATGGLSPEMVKERVNKYPPPEHCKFLCTTTIKEEV